MNFVAIVSGERGHHRVHNFLAGESLKSPELTSLNAPSAMGVWIIARNAKSTVSADRSTFFRGSAVLRRQRQLIFGLDGLASAHIGSVKTIDSAEGEFISVQAGDGGIDIVRDFFGHVRLLWTQLDDIVIVSDALLPLAEIRRQLGSPPAINEEALLARCVLNAVASQQLSSETIVDGVQFVPAGKNLRLRWDGEVNRVAVHVHGDSLIAGPPEDARHTGYRSAIRQGAADVAALVGACARVDGWNSSLSLSGGYDSRVVLAAADLMKLQSSLRVDSILKSDEHQRDFEVASDLATRFGFAFNTAPQKISPIVGGETNSDDAFTLWGASLAGVYDGMGPQTTRRAHANKFEFSGIGAELVKGNWGWQPWGELLEGIGLDDGEVKQAFDQQARRGLAEIDADPESVTTSEHWYAAYRNGIHGGAGHVSLHLTGLLPVQQRGLMTLAHSLAPRHTRGRQWKSLRRTRRVASDQTAIADLSMLLSPRVALHPYDDPRRDLGVSPTVDRLRWLGGALTSADVEPYTIHGHPSQDFGGTSPWALKVSEARGFCASGRATESLLDDSRERIESLSLGPVRDALREVQSNAEWRIRAKGRPLWFAGASVPKVLSLALFD